MPVSANEANPVDAGPRIEGLVYALDGQQPYQAVPPRHRAAICEDDARHRLLDGLAALGSSSSSRQRAPAVPSSGPDR